MSRERRSLPRVFWFPQAATETVRGEFRTGSAPEVPVGFPVAFPAARL